MVRNAADEFGSTYIKTINSKEQYLFEKRTWSSIKYWEWIFIVEALIEILITVGFQIYFIVLALTGDNMSFIPPIVIILGNCFATFFLFFGVMNEQPFQVLVQLLVKIVVFILGLVTFLSSEDDIVDENGKKDEIASQEMNDQKKISNIQFYISSSMLPLALMFGGYVLYRYWTSNVVFFKMVGTEPKYVDMCRTLFLTYSLMVFDMLLSVAAIVISASRPIDTDKHLANLISLPVAFVCLIIWLLIGIIGMRKENRPMTYIFYVFSHLQPIYLIFMMATTSKEDLGVQSNLLFTTIFVVSSMNVLIRIALLFFVVKVQQNYGKGLKYAIKREKAKNDALKSASQNRLNEREDFIKSNNEPPPVTVTEL